MDPNNGNHATAGTWIFSVLLGITVLAGSLSLVIKQTLLNPAFHRQIVREQLVVNQINADLPALFFNIERTAGLTVGQTQIPEGTLGNLVWSIIPADWVAGQVDIFIQRGIDFVESGRDTFAVTIDLTSIKSNMQAKAGEMANSVIAGMPVCTGKDFLGFVNSMLTGDNSQTPYCVPPKPFDTLFRTAMANSFSFMTQKMPDNITVVTLSLKDSALRPLMNVLRLARVALQVYRVVPFVILVLMAGLILTHLKKLRIAIRGIGIASLCSGLAILLVSLGIFLYGQNLNLAGTNTISLIPLPTALVAGYVKAVFGGVVGMLWKLGAVLAGAGVVVVLAIWLSRRVTSTDSSITPV